MRLNRTTLILLVVLALIIVAAVLLLRGGSDITEDNPLATSNLELLFGDLTADTVTAITITADSSINATATPSVDTQLVPLNIVLELNEDAGWLLGADSGVTGERPLDQTRIAQAISTLVGLRYRDSFTKDDVADFDLAKFGLDTPAYDITFTAGEESYRLRVGDKNPTETQYYALLGDDDSKVYLLSSASTADTVLKLLNEPPFIVEPTPTPVPVLTAPGPVFTGFPGSEITSLTLRDETSDEEIVLVREEAGADWHIDGDDSTIDQTSVSVTLSQFGALQAVDAVPGDNLEALGLAESQPQQFIIASISEDENYIAAIGAKDPTGTRYYVRINAYEQVAVIEADALDFVMDLLDSPPIMPEATPEVTAEVTGEATAEVTEAAGD